ncbi:post-GPI attachment to proteins factor 4-like [Physella acuta]|uniref:post-GPI attachment to proteins factor 4-like n=1 Tax=Physella acuta TaxID=109671 RepID=UPI0027DC0405|nr:post-GPI attachment to proteins factor 4-like [Physella acuta]
MMFTWHKLALLAAYLTGLSLLADFLPFSEVFSHLHGETSMVSHVEHASSLRSQDAQNYLNSIDPKDSLKLYRDRLKLGNITFAIGIITIKRTRESSNESLGYLLQSAASIDFLMKSNNLFKNSVPFICNVDTYPDMHLDAVTLYKFLPFTKRYGDNSLGLPSITLPHSHTRFVDLITHFSKYEKETFDYAFCLLSAAKLNPQYVILLEEDTLPHKDFPVVLDHILNYRLNIKPEKNKTDYLFLKLYYPKKWQGYGFDVCRLLDLLSVSVLATLMCSLVHYCALLKYKYNHSINRIVLCWFGLAVFTCWVLGRQNVSELRRVSKHLYRLQKADGCCTQAMLYPTAGVHNLSAYLVSRKGHVHTDLAIYDYFYLNDKTTYQVEPNLFFHTGLHTTLDLGAKSPEEFIF